MLGKISTKVLLTAIFFANLGKKKPFLAPVVWPLALLLYFIASVLKTRYIS